jgi:HPt (histidine-containing phosphotransfer) domain-containing protein
MPDRPLTAPELAAMFEATDNAELARQERALKAEPTDRLAEIEHRAAKAVPLTEVERLRSALTASRAAAGHNQQVLGGWEECQPCQDANDQCDKSLICDEAKQWWAEIDAAWYSQPTDDAAITQELRTQLATAERQLTELDATLRRKHDGLSAGATRMALALTEIASITADSDMPDATRRLIRKQLNTGVIA